MSILLRVDVDNAYLRFKVFNYLRLNYWFPSIRKFGYIDLAYYIANKLHEYDIPATFFFKRTTVPKNDFVESFSETIDFAFHAVRSSNINDFQKDLKYVETCVGRVLGFSKHGSGKWKGERFHTQEYVPEKLILFGKKSGLLYFSGNYTEFQPIAKENGFIYLPSEHFGLIPLTEIPINIILIGSNQILLQIHLKYGAKNKNMI